MNCILPMGVQWCCEDVFFWGGCGCTMYNDLNLTGNDILVGVSFQYDPIQFGEF